MLPAKATTSIRRALACRAFSLIELTIVIAIIGVVGAIASPRYLNSLSRYRAQAAANRIAADINLARSQAKISSAGQSIVFTFATSSYSLPAVAGLNGAVSAYSVSLAGDPYNATLVNNGSAVTTLTFIFDRFGQPSAGGSVSVQSSGYTQTIVVNATTGLASVQ